MHEINNRTNQGAFLNERKKHWESETEPFRIFLKLYFVGAVPASTRMVDTGDRLIIFNCGYKETIDTVTADIESPGIDAMDIKNVLKIRKIC